MGKILHKARMIFSSDLVWTWICRCFRHFWKRPNFSVFATLFGSGYAGLGCEAFDFDGAVDLLDFGGFQRINGS